jgi:hypothetical protein
MVAGTSKWSLLFSLSIYIGALGHARLWVAVFAITQALFLLCCWRWGYLESNAVKRKLRNTLVMIIGLLFIGLVAIEVAVGSPPGTVILLLGLDGVLVLGVTTAFALQITRFNATAVRMCFFFFMLLTFAPVVTQYSLNMEYLVNNHEVTSFVIVIQLLIIGLIAIVLAFKQKEPTKPIYNILGGQIAAVGDNSTASNVNQVARGNQTSIEGERSPED